MKPCLPLLAAVIATSAAMAEVPARMPDRANPILPGYYADPSLVRHGGKSYLYATLDPWGGETLGCWESSDFKRWTYRELNWPTKTACTSPTSKGAMVWAPSVVKGPEGRFHMYVSVGNEVWAGVADSPLGPWRNALGDKPLIPENFKPGFHMIDAEAFIDDDGQAYLYWGSGWNWVNGKCWAVKLRPDMVTFEGDVQDVTPANYFEAPFMVKHDGRYFLTYSSGRTDQTTYQVRYATGETPFGPFTEQPNSPILETNEAVDVISPGHHAVFQQDGAHYILYHRHSVPFDPTFIGRQICVDELRFTGDGRIGNVIPTHDAPPIAQGRNGDRKSLVKSITACSQHDPSTAAAFAIDDNYATRWAVAEGAKGGWLRLDLGETSPVRRVEIRPEYAWKPCAFTVERSNDGDTWELISNHSDNPLTGSPIIAEVDASARFLRIIFADTMTNASIWEVAVY